VSLAGRAARAVNIEDLRRAARRRLPRAVFDYIDGGADGEVTLRGNCRVFDTVAFRNLLMEPNINPDLTHNLSAPFDLTLELFRDIGWFPDSNLDGVPDR